MSVPTVRHRGGHELSTPAPDPLPERSELAERYRALRALVEATVPPRDSPRSVLIVGVDRDASEPGTLLAVSLARAGRTTVLVDADLRGHRAGDSRGVCQRLLAPEANPSPGLADWLARSDGDASTATPMPACPTGVPNLTLVPAGTARGDAGDLIGIERLGSLVTVAGSQREWVVVVAPPLAVAADALALARHVDGVLLVIRPGRTTRPAATRARDALVTAGGRVVGTLLGD